jgi:F-box and WD-40 domain protein CDC4
MSLQSENALNQILCLLTGLPKTHQEDVMQKVLENIDRRLLPNLHRYIEPLLRKDLFHIKNRMDEVDGLPREVIFLILRYLDLPSMAALMQTCKAHYALCASFLEYWRDHYRHESGDYALMQLKRHESTTVADQQSPYHEAAHLAREYVPPCSFPMAYSAWVQVLGNELMDHGKKRAKIAASSQSPWKDYFDKLLLYRRERSAWLTGSESRMVEAVGCHTGSVITCIEVICGGRYVLTASDDHTVQRWRTADGRLACTYRGHTGGVWALSVVGDVLLTGSTDRTLLVWDLWRGTLLGKLRGHGSTVRCALLYSQCNSSDIYQESAQRTLAASLLGLSAVSGSRDRTLRVWNVAKQTTRHILAGHTAAIRCMARQGNLLVSGSYDGTARVWDLEHGVCLHLLHSLQGNAGKLYAVAFHGHYIATGGMDALVHIWHAPTGHCLAVCEGHRGLVGGLQFVQTSQRLSTHGASATDRDNLVLVSSNTDGTLRVWNLPSGECLHRLKPPTPVIDSSALTLSSLQHTSMASQINGNHSEPIVPPSSFLPIPAPPLSCFHLDGHRLVAASDSSVFLFDTKREFVYVRTILSGLDVIWRLHHASNVLAIACQKDGMTKLYLIHVT